jgi:hypothetical protein
MRRRGFLKLSLITGVALHLPSVVSAKSLDFTKVRFNEDVNSSNQAQSIIVFLAGGASELCGNLTNLDEIKEKSKNSYNYFGTITKTPNNCWGEAGGDEMEDLISAGDMTLFRSCYSQKREETGNKAHGICTVENQKGSYDEKSAGILTNLALILEKNGVIGENSMLPFITLDGDSSFYDREFVYVKPFLKPVGMDRKLNNPYKRANNRDWRLYTSAERGEKNYNRSDAEGGFNPALNEKMDTLAQSYNVEGKIKEAFTKRAPIANFIDDIKNSQTPDLGANSYSDDYFSQKMETAIKIATHNPDTKVITLSTSGLGGWDDHGNARNYVERMSELFSTLKSAIAHLKATEKEQTINIMVFGEFGRNVNLNDSNGWDHGNLQNLFILGGKRYFSHKGVVGETELGGKGGLVNRLYLKPKSGTYEFDPMSIASTLYKIYGIDNPELITGGFNPINI